MVVLPTMIPLTSVAVQLLDALYFTAIFLALTSPVGGVLALVAFGSARMGPRRAEPLGVPPTVMRRAIRYAGIAFLELVGAAAYHGAFVAEAHALRGRFEEPPGAVILPLVALGVVLAVLPVIVVVRAARRRVPAAMWASVWLWSALVAAFVAVGGPALGAL